MNAARDAERYEIVVVRYGTTESPRSRTFLNDFVNGEPDRPTRLDYYFWVIRNERRTVLVDTGFDVKVGQRRGRTTLIDPLDAARVLGAGPEDAPSIIITHMHYDHVGNVAAYTESPITMARAELDFWVSDTATHAQFAHLQEDAETGALSQAAAAGRVTFIDEETEVHPGITVVPVGGHTAGQLMVVVETAMGPVLLTSDAVHLWEELDERRPFIYMDHLTASYAAYDRVEALSAGGVEGRVIPGHDPGALDRVPSTPMPALAGLGWIVGELSPPAGDDRREGREG